MMQRDDVAAIVKGLTDQMRNALAWPKEPMLIPNTLYAATINGLERRGLSGRHYALTPRGRAVRDYLRAAADADRGEG